MQCKIGREAESFNRYLVTSEKYCQSFDRMVPICLKNSHLNFKKNEPRGLGWGSNNANILNDRLSLEPSQGALLSSIR